MPEQQTRRPVHVGLGELLRGLPQAELLALAERTHVGLDSTKRIGFAEQLARALVMRPEIRRMGSFDASEQAILWSLASGAPLLAALEHKAQRLVDQGWVFPVDVGQARTLMLPIAYLLQLPSWQSEDRQALRVLLAGLPSDVASNVARHHFPQAVSPWPLALERAFAVLSSRADVRALIKELPDREQRLLREICRLGGEVEAAELLDLEREPLRVQRAGVAVHSRRGSSFELERRGLLLPWASVRHVVPAEVQAVVLEPERVGLTKARGRVVEALQRSQWAPLRARYAADPGAALLAMAVFLRRTHALRRDAGTPRSLIRSLEGRLGLAAKAVNLLAALGRRVGYFADPGAPTPTELGSLGTLGEVGSRLLQAWLEGSAWDDARPEPEVSRVRGVARQASPTRQLQAALVDALLEAARDRWSPLALIAELTLSDVRLVAFEQRCQRWTRRTSEPLLDPDQVIGNAVESLFALGALDLAESDQSPTASAELVRLSARARRWLTPDPVNTELAGVRPAGAFGYALGPAARVAPILAASEIVEVAAFGEEPRLEISIPAIEELAASGTEKEAILARVAAIGTVSSELEMLLDDLTRPRQRLDFVEASGFLWVDEPELREQLRGRASTAALFIEPSPTGGLLLKPGVNLERLVRACRAIGIAVQREGERVTLARAASPQRPGPKRPGPKRASSRET